MSGDAARPGALCVEVVYATRERQQSVSLTLAAGATVAHAVQASGLRAAGGEEAGYAIFGRRVPATAPLASGDRVEILRPLRVDPREARRRRAKLRRSATRR
jgi:putative ubiquitin-RnfH superfamily antitoxin RatB of RatAB toxin-antitoxin module